MRARLRVLVQPFSSVTHAESTTYGGPGREQRKAALMDNGRRKFLQKWRAVLRAHGPSKLSAAPKNEKWLRDHDDVFDQATRLYSFRVLLLALCDDDNNNNNNNNNNNEHNEGDFGHLSSSSSGRQSGQSGERRRRGRLGGLSLRLLATVRVLVACRAHVTIVFANRNGDEVRSTKKLAQQKKLAILSPIALLRRECCAYYSSSLHGDLHCI